MVEVGTETVFVAFGIKGLYKCLKAASTRQCKMVCLISFAATFVGQLGLLKEVEK